MTSSPHGERERERGWEGVGGGSESEAEVEALWLNHGLNRSRCHALDGLVGSKNVFRT